MKLRLRHYLQGQLPHCFETLILYWESRQLEAPSDEKPRQRFILRVADSHQR